MPTLPTGTRLGPYEITGALGTGGMGEVYRARDTRLNRDVAIKCLGSELSGDPASQQRIVREARACASLSHPNICALFDVGQHNGETFLVMELLTGETLAARLSKARSGLPLDEALGIATQIADAIAYAHQHQIVHRDLKPANVMLTREGARLLDFGIAKPSSTTDDTRSVITQSNERLGTPAYMAPEQLGGSADHRSDIYAFGTVLFEMLTGARAFASHGTLATLRPDTPPSLDRLVRKCLEKDLEKRWQSAADLADELRWIASTPLPPAGVRQQSWLPIAAAIGVTAVLAALIAIPRWGNGPAATALEQWSFLVPPNHELAAYGPGVAVSPDGSMIAFTANTSGTVTRRLFIKRVDSPEPSLIADTEDAISPFFSADSQFLAFFARGRLRRWSVATNSVTTMTEFKEVGDGSASTWSADNTILFGLVGDRPTVGIRRFAAAGGETVTLTNPDNAKGEQSHFGPQPLPNGRALFTVRSVGPLGIEFNVVARDESGTVTTLIPGASLAIPLDGKELIYQSGNALMVADFAPSVPSLSNARKVLDGIYPTTGGASWAIAGDTIVYRPIEAPRRRLVWVDRSGPITPIETELHNFSNPSISPANDRVAVGVQGQAAAQDMWILDLGRQTLAPLTRDGITGYPIWSPDGTLVMANRLNGAARDVVMQPADGSSPASLFLHTGEQMYGAAFADAGQLVVVMTPGPKTGPDIAVVDRDNPASLRYIVQTPAVEYGGRLSPDGKWLSYFSNASGRHELYVTPFPNGGPKWQLSRNGAREAVWLPNGRELYFRSEDRMYAIAVNGLTPSAWDPPRELFRGTFFQQGGPGNVHYDVARDGRFLMIQETPPQSPSINVVRGWRQLVQ